MSYLELYKDLPLYHINYSKEEKEQNLKNYKKYLKKNRYIKETTTILESLEYKLTKLDLNSFLINDNPTEQMFLFCLQYAKKIQLLQRRPKHDQGTLFLGIDYDISKKSYTFFKHFTNDISSLKQLNDYEIILIFIRIDNIWYLCLVHFADQACIKLTQLEQKTSQFESAISHVAKEQFEITNIEFTQIDSFKVRSEKESFTQIMSYIPYIIDLKQDYEAELEEHDERKVKNITNDMYDKMKWVILKLWEQYTTPEVIGQYLNQSTVQSESKASSIQENLNDQKPFDKTLANNSRYRKTLQQSQANLSQIQMEQSQKYQPIQIEIEDEPNVFFKKKKYENQNDKYFSLFLQNIKREQKEIENREIQFRQKQYKSMINLVKSHEKNLKKFESKSGQYEIPKDELPYILNNYEKQILQNMNFDYMKKQEQQQYINKQNKVQDYDKKTNNLIIDSNQFINQFKDFQQFNQNNPQFNKNDEFKNQMTKQIQQKLGLIPIDQKNPFNLNLDALQSNKQSILFDQNNNQRASMVNSNNNNNSNLINNQNNKKKLKEAEFISQKKYIIKPVTINTAPAVKRYEKQITVQELNNLQMLGQLNENCLNFFIRYLEEKQEILSLNKKLMLLTTNFYRCLCSGTKNIYAKEVDIPKTQKMYTDRYYGQNKHSSVTLVKMFNYISIPVVVEFGVTILVVFETKENTFMVFDPSNGLSERQNDSLKDNQIMRNIFRFFNFDSNMNLNIENYNFLKIKTSKINQTQNLVNLFIAYYIHQFLNKQTHYSVDEKFIFTFKNRMVDLFKIIGITQNMKSELQEKISQLPL